jgi:hypothetical protein
MKMKSILATLATLSILFCVLASRADDFNAVANGNWSDTNIWVDNDTTNVPALTVPGPNDDADIPAGIDVTVDTNVSVQYIYDDGTVTMATNSTLDLLTDSAIATSTTLDASAAGNTVIYSANPFFAKQTNYFNLTLENTNYVDTLPPYEPLEDFNNFSSSAGPTPMHIAGHWTVLGFVKVQQGSGGAPITIGGNLIIGTNCIWDCSGDNLTVASNVYVYGLLEDLNGALGTNQIGGSVIITGAGPSGYNPATGTGTNGWNVSNVVTWGVGGSLTNNGAIISKGYGSISFNGAGSIAGQPFSLPTMVVNGNYTIGTTITLYTNTPTLNGTLTFDIADTNKINYITGSTNKTLYYSGDLNVTNSGPMPSSDGTFQLFSANSYGGAFASETFPTLPAGLSWVDSTITNGSISIIGSIASTPITITSRNYNSATHQFMLTWASANSLTYSILLSTNLAPGSFTNVLATGIPSGGSSTTYTVTMPNGKEGFVLISQP